MPSDQYTAASGQSIHGGRNPPLSTLPPWVENLPLWQWYSIPNTALSSVEPADAVSNATIKGIQGPKAKIGAWCGATLRRQNSVYMLGATGGHGDYFGNETDALVLNTANPKWQELRAHSDPSVMYNLVSVWGDNRKSSIHTYWATQFDNFNDRMIIFSSNGPNGTLPAAPSGYPYPNGTPPVLMAFQYGENDWLPVNTLPLMPYASQSADLCCTNPLTGEVFINGSQKGAMHKYSPQTNSWYKVGDWYLNGAYAGSAIDPLNNRMLIAGSFSGTRAPQIRSIVDATQFNATFLGLGATELQTDGYPGIVYDEVNKTFLMLKNTDGGTIDVLRIDCNTFFVDRPVISNTIANRSNGIHNSVQYVPELKGIVIANSYTDNVKFMRTAA